MSSRALRKVQREREEQEQINKLKEQHEESEEETPNPPTRKGAFAMLNQHGYYEEHDADAAADHDTAEESRPNASSKTKKKKKKKKGKAERGEEAKNTAGDEELDEIDKALKQLSTNGDASRPATTSVGADATVDETSKLLAIETTHLHSQNEIRRLFGRAALEQNDDEDQPPQNANGGGNRRQQRQIQQAGLAQALRGQQGRGGGLSSMVLRRNIFIQGKEDWPQAVSGLAMEVEERRPDGTVLYRFLHNPKYQSAQRQFESAVESMDPNRLILLQREHLYPYHVLTLLQLSEVAKHQGDHATSGDLLERALFSLGKAVRSTFSLALSEGKARLDFARPENREFWLASWRYMQNLHLRATWRTCFTWSKMLLSLSPDHDAYGLWLSFDQYALRSRQDLDYLNISRSAAFKAVHKDMPNVQFSQGLAEIRAGNAGKGKQALFKAVGRYPWVAARLLEEVGLDPPPAVWGKEPRTDLEKLYTELYAIRAKDLWNTPETSAILLEIASALPPDTPAAPLEEDEIPPNVARHVLLSEVPSLISLLPRHYTTAFASVSDPLPPDNSYASYLRESQIASVPDMLQELQDLQEFFAELFPGRELDDALAVGEGENGNNGGEAMWQRIRESGTDSSLVLRRMRRVPVLRDRLNALMGDQF